MTCCGLPHSNNLFDQGCDDSHDVQLFYSSLVAGIILDCTHLLHYAHIWYLYGVNFTVVDVLLGLSLYGTYRGLLQRIQSYKTHRELELQIERAFPDATEEELKRHDDDCAICKEAMTCAKKLPCGHLFHKYCLRAWTERSRSCPVCRKQIRPDVDLNPDNGGSAENVFYFPRSTRAQTRERGSGQDGGGQQEMASFTMWNQTSSEQTTTSVSTDMRPSLSMRELHASEFWFRVDQIKSIFPNIDLSAIAADLLVTHSVEATIDNILQGRVRTNGGTSRSRNSPAAR